MRITFSGANREVTGSCYYLETSQAKLVLDCGMFQGGKYAEDKNSLPFPFNPAEIDAVLLTHAHFDHTGRLPKLYKEGFRGRIFCTDATSQLSMVTLRDSVRLMAEEAQRHNKQPLYGTEEVEPLQDLWSKINYHEPQEVVPGVTAYYTDAGHILGSASIRVEADGERVSFSGDLGNTPVPLLHNTESIDGSDLVIIESTYGNRVHEPAAHRYAILKESILDTVQNKGVLLIPAFALERTQELLYELEHLRSQNLIPKIPIYVDSPMAIAATEIYASHLDYFNTEARRALANGEDIFHFKGLTYTLHSQESKGILHQPGPKIIIAGSGMMNGGRILHHLKNYLGLASTTVLIIGYQVEGSLGRRLHHGDKAVQIYGMDIEVKASIRSCGAFSGHADYPRLINWLHGFSKEPPRKVFVTHGELNSALSFSQAVEDQFGIASGVPQYGEKITVNQLGKIS